MRGVFPDYQVPVARNALGHPAATEARRRALHGEFRRLTSELKPEKLVWIWPVRILARMRLGRGPTMQRQETTPLWVWLTVGLMALGSLAYFVVVFLAEYLMPGL
jgi:hypothetical protein